MMPFENSTPVEGANLRDEDEASSTVRRPSPGFRRGPSTAPRPLRSSGAPPAGCGSTSSEGRPDEGANLRTEDGASAWLRRPSSGSGRGRFEGPEERPGEDANLRFEDEASSLVRQSPGFTLAGRLPTALPRQSTDCESPPGPPRTTGRLLLPFLGRSIAGTPYKLGVPATTFSWSHERRGCQGRAAPRSPGSLGRSGRGRVAPGAPWCAQHGRGTGGESPLGVLTEETHINETGAPGRARW
jgi:hypothetical protein